MFRMTERDRLVFDRVWADPKNVRNPSGSAIEMIRLLRTQAGARPRVADIACGAGRHAIYAAEQGCDVTAIDHNEVAVAWLRERATSTSLRINVLHADLVDWVVRQPTGSFDAVICFDAIHHVSPDAGEVEACIRQMAALPRPGGLLLLTFLADIARGTGERPPGRLELTAFDADALLDSATEATESVKRVQYTIRRDVESIDPQTGELVPTTYRATRLLRLCRLPNPH